MIATFAMTADVAPQFDLMLGYHPKELHRLSYEGDLFLFLRFADRKELLSIQEPSEVIRVALLYLKYFPNIDNYLINYQAYDTQKLYENIWKIILEKVEILDLIYAFYLTDFHDNDGLENLQKTKQVHEASRELQTLIEQKGITNPQAAGKITWTLPFPANGPLGKVTEAQSGLSVELKQKLGLANYKPGLLCNFLLHHNIPIEEVLNPHQFEDLTGMLFQEEGWEITRMRKTRDGGKDVIAKKSIDGKQTTIYIYRLKDTRKNLLASEK